MQLLQLYIFKSYIELNSRPLKSLGSVRLLMFLKVWIKKYRKIVKYSYSLKQLFSIWLYFNISLIPVIKAVFSASLLQSSESHDPTEITLIWWFDTQETFMIIIISVENSWAAKCVWKPWCISLMNRNRTEAVTREGRLSVKACRMDRQQW